MQTKTPATVNLFFRPNTTFSLIKRPLHFAAVFLWVVLLASRAAGQVTITNASGAMDGTTYAWYVNFSTAQTGLSPANFTVTGVSGAVVSNIAGSGTSYAVSVTVPGNVQGGQIVLNMVNSNSVSPGVSGLPVSGPAITVINYPLTASVSLISHNSNPGYAKTGDQLYCGIFTNYSMQACNMNVGDEIVVGMGLYTYPQNYYSTTVVLDSGTPQGPLAYSWQYTNQFNQSPYGSGTSSIIFDSVNPTVTIGSPSAQVVGNNGTSSVSYNVNYSDANFGSSNLTASGISLNTTGTASGTVSVTGSDTSYVVTISNILGVGTLGISVGGGYATDLAGNTDTGAGPSQTVNVSGAIVPVISSVSPASGPVGTLVTISGTNLAAPTAFTIGGVPAIVVSNDGSTLVGMVMPGAVTGPVAFTNDGGTAGAGNFTVTPTLYPSLQQGPKLVAAGSTGKVEQGISVAVSADGNTAIVGGNFDNSSIGGAWVYTRSGGVWTQQGSKLVGNDAVGSSPNQGYSVAISADGNTAIVGGFGDNSSQGAAWVYTRSGGTWTQQGPKLVGTGAVGTYGAAQGFAVTISADGNTAAVGGYYDNSGIGAVWVYTRSGGTWTQQGAKLVGTGSAGSNVFQGWSVSLSADGNTLAAGGDADNSNLGAVWIYTRSGGTWTQQGPKLTGSDATANAHLGNAVAISADGNTAMAGGESDNTGLGAAWVYTRSGGVWTQQGSKLVPSDATPGAYVGVSVSLTADGNTAMVGGWFDNNNQGAAWVYTRNGGVWTQRGSKLVGTGSAGSFPEQGSSVSLSADGNTAMAGGFGDNNTLGAAWPYISLQAPTVQAGNVTFTNTGTLTTTANWTNGNGSSRAVFMYAGSSGSAAPVNNTAYNANVAFGLGDQIGSSGWYCVYNGTGNTVNITGLTAGAAYQLMVVEYNGSGSNVDYLTSTGTGNPAAVTTLPPPPPTITGFTPASGPVGTLVTISGTNLAAPTAFTIGGVPAIVVSNDGSTLVGMVMPGAVTGPLSFTTSGGTTAGSGNFTVTATLYPALQQGQKLVGSDNAGNAGQGYSVAVSADGNTAIVGGFQDNSGMGAAWIYTRSGGTWSQQGSKLVGTGAAGSAQQGRSVAISADGNTAIVGGPADNSLRGAAWIFTRSGGTWTQQGLKLVGTGVAASPGVVQGAAVAMSANGNTVAVGGPGDGGQGAVWVYTRSYGTWTQQGAKLVGTGAANNASQGIAVSLSADGNTVIVGGPYDNGSQGAAWVFTRSGGAWTQQGSKLVGTGAAGSADQGTSVSLSADGNTAIVGGPHDNPAGAAWVYTRSNGVWTQQGSKLVGADATANANMGNSVALSADGNTAIVGGPYDNQAQGAVWAYTRTGGTWVQQGSKLAGTGAAGTGIQQGFSVSLSADGNTAMAGGLGDNSALGATWVYISVPPPTLQAGNITFTNTTTLGTTASWTNGNGSSRAVFMFAGSSGSPAPVNNTAYNANASFGIGDQVGTSGWYCVYNGTGNTVNITGLTAGTTYQVMVVEYNGAGSNVVYLSTAAAGNPATIITPLPQPPTIASFSPVNGPAGTLVTINGTNLLSPTAFTIGGAPAIVISNDGSTLVGMVMPRAVTGPLSFTTAGGTAAGGGDFSVTPTSYPSLQQGSKLVGLGNTGNDVQGYSVAVSADGNTAIVGGWQDNNGVGAAWVYTRNGGVWTQQGQKLVGTGGAGPVFQQGYSVSLSADGNTAIIGGPTDNMNQGAAWVYTRSGGTWTQQGLKLVGTGSTGVAQQGWSVSLSADGNTAIVGGRIDNNSQGAAWVYTRAGGVWKQQGSKLVGTGATGNPQQGGSVSLSADGNTAIVGGPSDNSGIGAVWIYTRGGTAWTQQGTKLVSTDAAGNAFQGCSVSLSADGNTAIVGGNADNNNQGAAWVYTRSGGVWMQQGSKLAGSDATNLASMGASVSLSADGNTAVIGGPTDNNNVGATWVYTRSGGVWAQQGPKLVGTGATGNASQGVSVSLSADGNTAMTGGFVDNSSVGAAWAYVVSLVAPTTQAASVTFTNTSATATTASWTNGNGASRAVFMYAGASGSPAPVDNTAYNANAAFGTGDQVGSSGWYCVYNGTGNTVNITGLTAGTTYQVMVVEYNGSGSNVDYLTAAGTGNPASVTLPSANANLSYIQLSGSYSPLLPSFSPGITSYTTSVGNAIASLTVTPTTGDTSATVSVNSIPVTPGTASDPIALAVGDNVITVVVTAQDGITTKTYTVTITRPSANATLSNLKLNLGTLSPAFASTTTGYTQSVGNGVTIVKVIPTTTNANATITVNGMATVSGKESPPIALNVGDNIITTTVTAQDGVTVKTYTITVTRAPSSNAGLDNISLTRGALLSPAFARGTLSYTSSVHSNYASINLTPTTSDANATVTVDVVAVPSGSPSQTLPLVVGDNVVTVVVTAQDGITTKTYTVTITRPSANATLSNLKLNLGALSPAFASATTGYTQSVGNGVTIVKVIPTTTNANATITVNGMATVSGQESSPIALNVGDNIITTIVTAQDGVTTDTYTITVTRAPSSNAGLDNISLTRGAVLSPAFARGTLSYTSSVRPAYASINLTPVASDATAAITVNGVAVPSGSPSQTLPLVVGDNVVTVVVTAQDGITTKTYTVTITRPSANATLSNLKLNLGALSPAFASATTGYTQSVGNGVTIVKVIPTTTNANATITVNGMATVSGKESPHIPLNVGDNIITTIVTAQDGVTTDTYTITVTRAMAPMNSLYEPVGVVKPAGQPQLADDGIVVHQGVSPNGDGINDVLTIDGISNYPDNKLMIMSPNGVLVYETKGYDNNARVFDGHSNKTGLMQQPGTYFYSLDYTVKGITKHKTGFIVLKY